MSTQNQKTILLVDSDISIASSEKKELETHGYKIIVANTAEKAIDFFKKNNTIDLILMDIDLGKSTESLDIAITILKEREIPIMFIISRIEPKIVKKIEKITFYGYILKNSAITVWDASIKLAFKQFETHIKTFTKLQTCKREKKTLLEDNEKLKMIFDNANDGLIVIDFDSKKICDANKSICRMLGYNIEEFMKLKIADIHPEKELSYVLEQIERQLKVPQAPAIDLSMKRKDGSIFYANVCGSIITLSGKNYLAGIFRDITDRKHMEEALQKSESRCKAFFMNVGVGIIVANMITKQFLYANPAVCRMFGYTEEEFLKLSIEDIHPKEDMQRVLSELEAQVRNEKVLAKDIPGLCKDGTLISININSFKLVFDGHECISCIYTDITDHKNVKNKLEENQLMLKEVHHRIKNNMNNVIGIMSLQLRTLKDQTAIAALKDARSRVLSMMVLYDKLYCSTDCNEISFEKYFTPLVNEIISNFPNNGIVKTEIIIEDFKIDSKRLSHIGIIINELITNTMKYAFIDRDNGLITLSAKVINNHTAISIQDNGIGIPESIDATTSNGLGFKLIDTLTKALKGTMKIERNNGTKFILEFNL